MRIDEYSVKELKSIIKYIEEKKLTKHSHLYKRYPNYKIGEAAEIFSKKYNDEAKIRPGLILLSVIMSIHANYTKQVEPNINRARKQGLQSFNDLKFKLSNFGNFSTFSGMKSLDKYKILQNLMNVIDKMKFKTRVFDDYKVMEWWAKEHSYHEYERNEIGRIKGIGLATFQHLRMNFGVDTVKPDQRVKEVLSREFGLKIKNDKEAISAVEYIAEVLDKKVLYIDQILVNYGSGYYKNKKDNLYKSQINNEKDKLRKEFVPENRSSYKSTENNLSKYIREIALELDVTLKKRGDNGTIVEANELTHLKRGKNVFTFWENKNSISIIILGELPRTTFYSIDELINIDIKGLIHKKYISMGLHYRVNER